MSSTAYNVGVGDLKRPTSKVLAPPGGQTSIGFGEDASHTGRVNMANDSSSLKSALQDERQQSAPAPVADAPAQPAAPTRARVPPGGFSSGLW